MRKSAKWVAAVAAVSTMVIACDRSPTALPSGSLEFAAAVDPGSVAAVRQVTVCKEGPAGTYNFTIVANTGNVTLPYGGSFTLAADECKTVAVQTDQSPGAANLQSVTVTELTPPTGTLFLEVDVYRYTSSGLGSPSTSTNPAVTAAPFGEDAGYVIVYKNVAEPVTSLDGRMTGGGSVFLGETRFTHGFELHCDVNDLPNNLEVNWPDNRFHLTALTSVVCTDDPALNPLPRKAGFDTYTATGVGLWNGQPGATIEFVFTDNGEPGTKDHATMTITPPGGSPVTVDGFLEKGNHQAHWVN